MGALPVCLPSGGDGELVTDIRVQRGPAPWLPLGEAVSRRPSKADD